RLAAHGRTLRASGWSQPRTLAVCLVRSNRLAWNKYTLSPIMSTVGSLVAHVQVECLVDVIDELVTSDDPQDKLKRFTKALHEVFVFGRSTKHMIQRQLGRLEPTPALKYRAHEVMRNMPVMSTCKNLRLELHTSGV